ncbi:ubiquinone biosynthesis regulatory protein kinase UbiB [Methylobacter sp. S3L5C]|uniref:ubiquinone biosynthesis regulatory protein kinase UbiB n=1 Tax=Methylobacter sp. S3L5C TaxID=2839024 RepID=UPI001FABAAD0|nr:ubiquinone biosynthesis regulatory protein kinase UbiB [Methylobacter sp. S3L5C]UOA08530.1 ubiquinone biosynthesis regulatory protein kinase UbiB [Methylobacter sp. S3L5C]
MIRPKLVLRLIHINWVLVVHGLDEIVLKTHLFRPIRYLAFITPSYWLKPKADTRGVRIRRALEDLGPIYVKFGQALSTRKDLLPDDISDELVKLQDRVPPFANEIARSIIETELGMSITEAFAEFDPTPLASASVAQVHTAVLHTGENVIVKVLRPDIEDRIRSDIGLLYELARFAERFWSDARRLRAIDVVAEFERSTLDELDLVREAANAAKLRRNFENSELIYIPEVHWSLTRKKVMVMERIYGIPVGEIEQLKAAGADFKALAERGVEIFFTQVFRDNFFHADMHPGNIFVDVPDKYIAVDFGIVGSLSLSDQRYLAENFLAFFNRDYRKVAEMHVESGWVPSTTRIEEFESAIRSVCEPIFEKPLKDISFGQLLLRLFQTARRFDMHVQPQLVLLQKTLLNIEGLGRQLYPELDLWQTAKPFLEKWFHERLSPKAKINKIIKQFPAFAEQFPEIPSLLYKALDNAANSQQHAEVQQRELTLLRQQMDNNHKTTVWAMIISAIIISAAVLFQ